MGKQDELAAFLHQCNKAGVDVGNFSVVPQGVVFKRLQIAKKYAAIHIKDLVRIDGQVSGWLARNKSRAKAKPKTT